MDKQIKPINAKKILNNKKAILLDVREEFEIDASKLKFEFVHIPLKELQVRLGEIPKNKTIFVLCHHGKRSLIATNFLNELGFDAFNISGVIEEWSKIDKNIPRYQKFQNRTTKIIE